MLSCSSLPVTACLSPTIATDRHAAGEYGAGRLHRLSTHSGVRVAFGVREAERRLGGGIRAPAIAATTPLVDRSSRCPFGASTATHERQWCRAAVDHGAGAMSDAWRCQRLAASLDSTAGHPQNHNVFRTVPSRAGKTSASLGDAYRYGTARTTIRLGRSSAGVRRRSPCGTTSLAAAGAPRRVECHDSPDLRTGRTCPRFRGAHRCAALAGCSRSRSSFAWRSP